MIIYMKIYIHIYRKIYRKYIHGNIHEHTHETIHVNIPEVIISPINKSIKRYITLSPFTIEASSGWVSDQWKTLRLSSSSIFSDSSLIILAILSLSLTKWRKIGGRETASYPRQSAEIGQQNWQKEEESEGKDLVTAQRTNGVGKEGNL